MRHVLVVDDEPAISELMQLALEADGSCRVTRASNAGEAAAVLRGDRPHAVIIDAVLPQVSGLKLACEAVDLGVPVLIVTGEPTTREKLNAVGCSYLSKPFPINVLVVETNTLLDEGVQRRAQLALLLARLVARSAPLQITGERVHEAARRNRVRRSASVMARERVRASTDGA